MREFLDWVTGDDETHPTCGRCHPMSRGPELNKKGDDKQHLILLPESNVTRQFMVLLSCCPCHHGPYPFSREPDQCLPLLVCLCWCFCHGHKKSNQYTCAQASAALERLSRTQTSQRSFLVSEATGRSFRSATSRLQTNYRTLL